MILRMSRCRILLCSSVFVLACLLLFLVSACSDTSCATSTCTRDDYIAMARADAQAAGINGDYFVKQMNEESGFNPDAVSPAGAIGIAQFMPTTAQGLGIDPHDPVASLNAAAQLMSRYLSRYGGDYAKALAAYNAGAGTVAYAVDQGGSNWQAYLPLSTQHYIAAILD